MARNTPGPSIDQPTTDDLAACEDILRALPDWFGIEEAIDAYLDDMRRMDTLIYRRDGEVGGFLTWTAHNETTMEIHVMAVAPRYHRTGIGRALVEEIVNIARATGHRLLEVKTLGPSHPSEHYAATRRFYRALGFLPVEEIHGLWPGNPCLIMVKVLET